MLDRLPLRLLRLFVGLFLYGFADALMIRGAVGISPWTVFSQGLSLSTGLSIGLLTSLIGLAVLLLWIPLRQRPGFGTVANVLLLGPFIDVGLWLLPAPPNLLLQVLSFTAGLLLLAVASGLYIGARFGPGPRDGLMTGIHSRLGWPIWLGRTLVEATVLGAGWLLGGDVGFGTLAFALLIGPLCGVTIPLLAGRHRAAPARGRAAPAAGRAARGTRRSASSAGRVARVARRGAPGAVRAPEPGTAAPTAPAAGSRAATASPAPVTTASAAGSGPA
ncbi:membrane protein YczE [Herbiconiux liangxiaofengii]|uniref:membrane protein YczE n=1 Tax=Herbiconiux liangxiaofengii TaxID=3342795 RepID=UPI0035B80A09